MLQLLQFQKRLCKKSTINLYIIYIIIYIIYRDNFGNWNTLFENCNNCNNCNSVTMSNQHPSLESRGWGWLIMRQRKSTPPSLPFLRGGISLPKNSVICAKNTRLSKLISKKISPRTTDAFGLPLSGNTPSAQRKQGTCKKALNFVQICRQIACQNLQKPEECRIFVVPFESGRG